MQRQGGQHPGVDRHSGNPAVDCGRSGLEPGEEESGKARQEHQALTATQRSGKDMDGCDW